jgi:hypothetical protein
MRCFALVMIFSMLAAAPHGHAGCDGVEAQVGSDTRCLRPKDTFKDCSECPEMVVNQSTQHSISFFLLGFESQVLAHTASAPKVPGFSAAVKLRRTFDVSSDTPSFPFKAEVLRRLNRLAHL